MGSLPFLNFLFSKPGYKGGFILPIGGLVKHFSTWVIPAGKSGRKRLVLRLDIGCIFLFTGVVQTDESSLQR
jgi:hypothetical protein